LKKLFLQNLVLLSLLLAGLIGAAAFCVTATSITTATKSTGSPAVFEELFIGFVAVVGILVVWLAITLRRTDPTTIVLKKHMRQHTKFQEHLRKLSYQLAEAEEKERRKISMVLHDDVGQLLASAKMVISRLQEGHLEGSIQGDTSSDFSDSLRLLDGAIRSIRTLTFDLGSPVLYELGLAAALETLTSEKSRQYGFPIVLTITEREIALDPEIEAILYRATSELVLNAAKHGNPNTVTVSLSANDTHVYLVVADNGNRMEHNQQTETQEAILKIMNGEIDWTEATQKYNLHDTVHRGDSLSTPTGLGLLQLRERLRYLKGDCFIESSEETGFNVILTIPVRNQKTIPHGHISNPAFMETRKP